MAAAFTESCQLQRKSEADARGIAFGSYDGVSIEGACTTTAADSERRDIADLLASLSRCLDRRHDISTLRSVFEETIRRIVPVRSIQLREGSCPWTRRVDAAGQTEAIALEVPAADPDRSGLLEAGFDPACGLDEGHFHTLGIAAHVGSLVLEIERLRLQLARAGLWVGGRQVLDGPRTIVGSTPVVHELRATIERVAATDFTVLLEGESGVGKELVARQIHDRSRRRNGPFVAINCAALVETLIEAELFGIEDRVATGVKARRGKFEAAAGGTLFMDEVSDLSPSAQAKLLRAIQDLAVERVGGNGAQRVDVRIIAATNRGLRGLVDRGVFRPDLFYRLSGVDVRVPTLRERPEDVLELARHFLSKHLVCRRLRFSPEVADALLAYDWPGNVRELERVIERLVTMVDSEVIELSALPLAIGGDHLALLGPALEKSFTLRTWACRYTRIVLERCEGNKSKAARILGISTHTLKTYLSYPPEEIVETAENGSPGTALDVVEV
jgi:DNA-binding NtrC family response regulator